MFFYFFILIFFLSLKQIGSIQKKNMPELKVESDEPSPDYDPITYVCFRYTDIFNNNYDYSEFIRCFLNVSRYHLSEIKLEVAFYIYFVGTLREQGFDLPKNLTLIIKLLNETQKSGIIDQVVAIAEKNSSIIDYLTELIDEYEQGVNRDYIEVYTSLSHLFNIDGVYDILDLLYNNSKNVLFELLEEVLQSDKTMLSLFNLFKDHLVDYERETLKVVFDVIKYYFNSTELLNSVARYIKENKGVLPIIEDLMDNSQMEFLYKQLFAIENDLKRILKDVVFESKDTRKIFFSILQNDTLIDMGAKILANINDDDNLKELLPGFFSEVIKINNTYLEKITDISFDLLVKINGNYSLSNTAWSEVQKKINEFLKENNFTSLGFSPDCLDLYNNFFFDYHLQEKRYFMIYTEKFLIDGSRTKGNYLTFDNCLSINQSDIITEKYILYPVFVIGFFNDLNQSQNSKNHSLFLKYNFIRSFCLGTGYKNEEELQKNNPMCNENDLRLLTKFFSGIFENVDNLTIETISLYEKNSSPKTEDYVYGIIAFVILLIPLFISIFLSIYKNIKMKKNKRTEVINQLIEDDGNAKKKNTFENELIQKNKNIRRKIIFPKWYIFLNEYFNIIKNGKELFNFSLDDTNYNNIKGLTYIRGIIGISIILSLFGQTYIALVNLPMREYGIWDFYRIMSSPLYIIIFIGYRYSPRVLFSCSGYTLIYKFLCYIEQERGLYLIKFMFLQIYKYILLFLSIIFFRYLIFYIYFIVRQTKRPGWATFEYFMDKEENLFSRFFSFLFKDDDNIKKMRQNLIEFFYIPINEVFFFLVGTIFISFGYKYKLRIDLIILILIFILYVSKIVFHFIYWYPKENYLATVDYFLCDHGITMLNPIYNLSCFLIGMYFGLINYCIEKGINNIYFSDNKYDKIIHLKLSESEPERQEKEEIIEFKKKLTTKINKLIINNDGDDIENIIENNSKKYKKNKTAKNRYNIDNIRKEDVNDINEKSNKNIEKFLEEEDNKNSKKEYSEKIKQMPFLITPCKFSNFHRRNKNKWYFITIMIISLLLLLSFLLIEIIFINVEIKNPDMNIELSKIILDPVLNDLTLNIIYLVDIEIVVFIIQWGTFMLNFKELQIIRRFLNHYYWSFFVKGYFTFFLISSPVIILIFYETETAIKLNIFNIFLYSFIDIVLIFLLMIVYYSCYELPLKKLSKRLIKGNKEKDGDEEEEENESEEEESSEDDNE